MTKITLTNDYHGTDAVVMPHEDARGLYLTHGQVVRAYGKLCGMRDCHCGGYAGERGGRYEVSGPNNFSSTDRAEWTYRVEEVAG